MASVLTLSYSSTVTRLLTLPGAPAQVIVAEARPLFEGRKLIERLIAAERNVTCITDAAVARFVGGVDAVLIGADTIGRDGAAINKIGSLAAALAAKEAGVPFFVAADTLKLNPRAAFADLALEEMASAEIWPERASLCRNVYFDIVPVHLITAFITEHGVREPDGLTSLFAVIEARLRAIEDG